MCPGQLYIISAPSGAGKTTLVKRLIENLPYVEVSVSLTTRTPRKGEIDGVAYHFVSVDDFLQKIEEQDFFEHAEVFGNYYGTSRSKVEQRLHLGQDVILEIDYQGAQQIRVQFPQVKSIFILPPSLEELEHRLRSRATDADDAIARRLSMAQKEMSHYNEYDYLVINDDLDTAYKQLQAIFAAGRQSLNMQKCRHERMLAELCGG